MKTFFDGVYVSYKTLEEAGIHYPIKLEYYKTSVEENVEQQYGIEIVKTEFNKGNINIESEEVQNVTNDELEQNRILTLLKNNEVTPVGLNDVLQELLHIPVAEMEK